MNKDQYIVEASALLRTLFAALVDAEGSVQVRHVVGEQTVQFFVLVARDNVGQALGKQGRNIEAVRRILYSFANKHRIRTVLELEGVVPSAAVMKEGPSA